MNIYTQAPTNTCLSRPTARFSRSLPGLFIVLLLGLAACQKNVSPPTASFGVAPAAVSVGDPVTLSWRGMGAASCTLTTGQEQLTPENCDRGSLIARYDQAGTFLAELAYTFPDGSTLSRAAPVTVRADSSFSAEQDGLSVTFEVPAAEPNRTTFAWDFGDGETGSGARVTHRYARTGDYLVTLTTTGAGQPVRRSRTITVEASAERMTLFSGNGLAAWERVRGGAANWRLAGDYVEVKPGKRVGENSLRTKETFGDFRLHLEFWVPKTSPGTPEQARGNSGVYLQGRYEVQILDSYGRTLSGQNDAGAIYEVRDATQNASLPPETWQSYDLEFRAARFRGEKKLADARVRVFWNGQLVQDDTIIPGPTRLGTPEAGAANAAGVLEGPIVLQDHGDRVRFRNLWLEPL